MQRNGIFVGMKGYEELTNRQSRQIKHECLTSDEKCYHYIFVYIAKLQNIEVHTMVEDKRVTLTNYRSAFIIF